MPTAGLTFLSHDRKTGGGGAEPDQSALWPANLFKAYNNERTLRAGFRFLASISDQPDAVCGMHSPGFYTSKRAGGQEHPAGHGEKRGPGVVQRC